jgi:hypothetical protein
MSHPFRISLVFLTLLAGLLLAWGMVQAVPVSALPSDIQEIPFVPTPTPLPEQPEVYSPDISFIDSPSASCELPRAHTGVCYVTWYYMYASADPNYIISMTVGIDSKLRARYTGFFQTEMYVPSEMMAFQVPCGAVGSGGNPLFGAIHNYTLRARDSSGLSAANYGSVTCPADEPYRTYLAVLSK